MAITDAAQIKNPLLSGPFRFELNAYSAVFFQKCKPPGWEFEKMTYGGAGQTTPRQQAGMGKEHEMTAEFIVSAEGSDKAFWNTWHQAIKTRDTSKYFKDATLTLLGPNDNPSKIWELQDIFVTKLEWEEFTAEDKKKFFIGKVTFAVNDYKER
jgi:hypothetical protein